MTCDSDGVSLWGLKRHCYLQSDHRHCHLGTEKKMSAVNTVTHLAGENTEVNEDVNFIEINAIHKIFHLVKRLYSE